MIFRRGRHNDFTVYLQWGEKPVVSDDRLHPEPDQDMFIGAVRTSGFAELIVTLLNEHLDTLTPDQRDLLASNWREAEYEE